MTLYNKYTRALTFENLSQLMLLDAARCAGVLAEWRHAASKMGHQQQRLRQALLLIFLNLARATLEDWLAHVRSLKLLRRAVNKVVGRSEGGQIRQSLDTWLHHMLEFKRLRIASRRVLLSRMLKVAALVINIWNQEASSVRRLAAKRAAGSAGSWARERELSVMEEHANDTTRSALTQAPR